MQRTTLDTTFTTIRILLGVFFILSGIANYLHFQDSGGLLATVTTQKLRLWGWGFDGVGPLPALLALPYAYLLPAAEIATGLLFAIGFWPRYTGAILIMMLTSFVLAFGLFPTSGILPNNESAWDKNVFIALLVLVCLLWEEMKQGRTGSAGKSL